MGHTKTVDTEFSAILSAITGHPDFPKLGFETEVLSYMPLWGLNFIYSKLARIEDPQALAKNIAEIREIYRKEPYKARKEPIA